VKSREINELDKEQLDKIISNDEYHKDLITSDFFYAPGTYTKIYEKDDKPVFYIRATKSLRVDLQFVDINDKKNNALALIETLNEWVELAKKSGFTEIYCNTASSKLADFCVKHLGFIKVDKEVLRKLI